MGCIVSRSETCGGTGSGPVKHFSVRWNLEREGVQWGLWQTSSVLRCLSVRILPLPTLSHTRSSSPVLFLKSANDSAASRYMGLPDNNDFTRFADVASYQGRYDFQYRWLYLTPAARMNPVYVAVYNSPRYVTENGSFTLSTRIAADSDNCPFRCNMNGTCLKVRV